MTKCAVKPQYYCIRALRIHLLEQRILVVFNIHSPRFSEITPLSIRFTAMVAAVMHTGIEWR